MTDEVVCPGCGLSMPRRDGPQPDIYFNTSRECWAVYNEVLAEEFNNPEIFAQIHVMSVDTYAVQHAGAAHPDKSVCGHLCSLHLQLDRGVPSVSMPDILRRIISRTKTWPHFDRPDMRASLTAFDVAMAPTSEKVAVTRRWAAGVWNAWREHHGAIARFVDETAFK